MIPAEDFNSDSRSNYRTPEVGGVVSRWLGGRSDPGANVSPHVISGWDEVEVPSPAVWCEKTVVLAGLAALQGERISPSGLIDAISLVDALVWFETIVVDDSLQVGWPSQIVRAIRRLALDRSQQSELQSALMSVWNDHGVPAICEDYWRRLLDEPAFELRLWRAGLAVDSPASPEDFHGSIQRIDVFDLLASTWQHRLPREQISEWAAVHTSRAFAGCLVAARAGLFHLSAAVRRGLLGHFAAPAQVTDLIAIRPLTDERLPSAFGRVASVAHQEGLDLWDAVAVVRDEVAPVRRSLATAIQDPSRIRPGLLRHQLGFDGTEWQVGLGAGVAVVSGSIGRSFPSRGVAVVQRLQAAALSLQQASDDLCRLARVDRPVIDPALADLSALAERLVM